MSSRTIERSIRRRPSRSIPAIVVALALLAIAVAASWSGITTVTGTNTAVVESVTSAAGTPWSAQAVYIPSIAVAFIGLALIIAALIPGRYDAYLVNHGGTAEAALTGRGLTTYLEDGAADIDGVDSARASLTGRRADIRIGTYALDRQEVEGAVHQRLRSSVDSLNLTHTPRLRVHTNTLKG